MTTTFSLFVLRLFFDVGKSTFKFLTCFCAIVLLTDFTKMGYGVLCNHAKICLLCVILFAVHQKSILFVEAGCATGWMSVTTGQYCYQRPKTGPPFSYQAVLNQCLVINSRIPVFHTQNDYNGFYNYWRTLPLLPNFLIDYQHIVGIANSSDVVSWFDGRAIIPKNPWLPPLEPNFLETNQYCVMMFATTTPDYGWNDRNCTDAIQMPICQQYKEFDPVNFLTFPCTPLCQAYNANGRIYRTNPKSCKANGTVENPNVGYVLSAHSNGLSEMVYEMKSKTNRQTVYVYSNAKMQTMLANHTLQNGFVVATSRISSDMTKFILMTNASNMNTVIVKYNSTTHSNLTTQGWIDVDTFHLFNAMNNYTCSLHLDCEWNSWTDWSACSVTCGVGTMFRNRTKNVIEARNGTCDNNSTDVQVCGLDTCPPDTTTSMQTTVTTSTPKLIQTSTQTQSSVITALFEAAGITSASSDSIALQVTMEDSIAYILSALSLSEKMSMGNQIGDNIRTCMFDGHFCDMDRDFVTIYDPAMGNCFTFNYGNVSHYQVVRAGEGYGLTILLNSEQDEYLCSTSRAGFRIFVHNPALYPFVDNMGNEINPGMISSFYMTKVNTQLLGSPYGECETDDSRNRPYYYAGSYTMEGCLRSCYQDSVIKHCGCGNPRIQLPHGNDYCNITKKRCIEDMSACEAIFNRTKCGCNSACVEVLYAQMMSIAHIYNSPFVVHSLVEYCSKQTTPYEECVEFVRKNFAILKISFRTLNMQNYEEVPSYELENFFADFSNVLGLLLGICVITVAEIAVFVISCLTSLCTKAKK